MRACVRVRVSVSVSVSVCVCVRVDGAVGQLLNSARLEDHSGCPCWLCPQQKMTNGSMSRVFDHNYREREKEKKTRREGQRERDVNHSFMKSVSY